jgi:hypothetical protein
MNEIQDLYNHAENLKRKAHEKIDLIYNERIKFLDSQLINVTSHKINEIMNGWNNSTFDINFHEDYINPLTQNFIRINSKVFNQFNFNMINTSKSCTCISIMFCYFFETIYNDNNMIIENCNTINDENMTDIMINGTKLFNRWEKNGKKNIYPTVIELLKSKSCQKVFNKCLNGQEEFGGIVKIEDEKIELSNEFNGKPTLESTFLYATNLFFNYKINCVSLVITCKIGYTFSVILTKPLFEKSLKKEEKLKYKFDIYFFDSHGRQTNQFVDFIKCQNIESIINYIIQKYQIPIFKNKEIHNDLLNNYVYSSVIFYNKNNPV